MNSPPHKICHCDFHAINIMLNDEDIVVCDWQCVGIGKGAGDISFFISRGKAEVYNNMVNLFIALNF